jgi:hypothetical protein
MPDGGVKAKQMLEQIEAIEARGWTMARDGFWHHPQHTEFGRGKFLEDAVEIEDIRRADPTPRPLLDV